MSRTIAERLEALNRRRSGSDRLAKVDSADHFGIIARSFLEENYQKRAKDLPFTKYALGSMQEVSEDYTRVSIETAERVGNQLKSRLADAGISVEFRLQGSVPLNCHIRGVSDVDLLNIDTSIFTYHVDGTRARAGFYSSPSGRTTVEVLSTLRRESERILRAKFPAATLDVSGGKAIKIFGGSLARPVDVVPALWNDSIAYQASSKQEDRGVTILDKKNNSTLNNLPFLHIKRIHDLDGTVMGGLKKAIRLCKNVKSDAEDDSKTISLPSFDIAGAMYHANLNALRNGYVFELAILAETQRHLDWMTRNPLEANKLLVPDGSRPILDSEDKRTGLLTLSLEMDELLKSVIKERNPQLPFTWQGARDAVSEAYIPAA